jgi:hypothetical protein
MRNAVLLLTFLIPASVAPPLALKPAHAASCLRLDLSGEVAEGQTWSAPIGNGWRIRLAPIPPLGKGYSGWDIAIEPSDPIDSKDPITRPDLTGYPDALLLATPPYGSINQREIGTTYGLRAQDAVAWSPRRFQFLTSTGEMTRARQLYQILMAAPAGKSDPSTSGSASAGLVDLLKNVSHGQLTILDATLVAGVNDPPPFAQQWASHLGAVPHTLVQNAQGQGSDSGSARGQLRWMRFSIALWLPAHWRLPAGTSGRTANCAQ